MPKYATADRVGRDELVELVRPRQHGVLITGKGPIAAGDVPAPD